MAVATGRADVLQGLLEASKLEASELARLTGQVVGGVRTKSGAIDVLRRLGRGEGRTHRLRPGRLEQGRQRLADKEHIGDELLAEEQPPHSPTNEQGTEIARLVFRLRKKT